MRYTVESFTSDNLFRPLYAAFADYASAKMFARVAASYGRRIGAVLPSDRLVDSAEDWENLPTDDSINVEIDQDIEIDWIQADRLSIVVL